MLKQLVNKAFFREEFCVFCLTSLLLISLCFRRQKKCYDDFTFLHNCDQYFHNFLTDLLMTSMSVPNMAVGKSRISCNRADLCFVKLRGLSKGQSHSGLSFQSKPTLCQPTRDVVARGIFKLRANWMDASGFTKVLLPRFFYKGSLRSLWAVQDKDLAMLN